MKTYPNWNQAPNRFDALRGGSVARLRKYRANLAHSLETICGCRTPEAAAEFIASAGYTSPLSHRHAWMGDARHRRPIARRGERVARLCFRTLGTCRRMARCRRRCGRDRFAQHGRILRRRKWRRDLSRPCMAIAGALCIYDDKDDAARAGDGIAERRAERDREYSERWRDASDADSDRNDARDDLKSARGSARSIIAALRELPPVVDGVADAFSVARAQLRARLDDARGIMRHALERIAECVEKIADLDMTGEF